MLSALEPVVSFGQEDELMSEDHNARIEALIHEISRAPELGTQLVNVYKAEIADYGQLSQAAIEHDVLPNSIALVEQLLASIHSGHSMDEEFEAQLRDAAVRRFHQGVSIEGLLQSYRLWGRSVWQAIRQVTDTTDHEQVEASLQVVDRIMSYVDHASTVVAQAFFAEVAGITTDRSLIRGDTLDALLGAPSSSSQVERRLAALAPGFEAPHIVIVIRGDRSLGAGSAALRSLVDKVRDHLRPRDDRLTLGIRSSEVIAIYPTAAEESAESVYQASNRLAESLGRGVVGLGRRQTGMVGIALGYGEAAEAAAIADSLERFGQATQFRDVLLDHLGRTSKYSTSLIEDTIKPLQMYDENRSATLVLTLRTFYESRFSLTRSARELHVHPNTITYRLRRIHELTGLDPSSPDDLLLLSMGLKLGQLDRPS